MLALAYFGQLSYLLFETAWYSRNSEGKSHAVGLQKPNLLGIHDMLGNGALIDLVLIPIKKS